MTDRVVILISGGMDSAVCIAEAKHVGYEPFGLHVDYGQRNGDKEQRAIADLARHYGFPWDTVLLENAFGRNPILEGAEDDGEIIGSSTEHEHSPAEVPFRNGILAALGTAYAVRLDAHEVWLGVHRAPDTESVYPDSREYFVRKMGDALYFGTGEKVQLYAPFSFSSKLGVVTRGQTLGVPWQYTMSCYLDSPGHCWRCFACTDRTRAFNDAGIKDPLHD